MNKQIITLTYVKSTKGTHVYHTDNPAAITSIYIRKEHQPQASKQIKITVEEISE